MSGSDVLGLMAVLAVLGALLGYVLGAVWRLARDLLTGRVWRDIRLRQRRQVAREIILEAHAREARKRAERQAIAERLPWWLIKWRIARAGCNCPGCEYLRRNGNPGHVWPGEFRDLI